MNIDLPQFIANPPLELLCDAPEDGCPEIFIFFTLNRFFPPKLNVMLLNFLI